MTSEGNCASERALTTWSTDIPGLWDVELPTGEWRTDLTQGQVTWLAMTTGCTIVRGRLDG